MFQLTFAKRHNFEISLEDQILLLTVPVEEAAWFVKADTCTAALSMPPCTEAKAFPQLSQKKISFLQTDPKPENEKGIWLSTSLGCISAWKVTKVR